VAGGWAEGPEAIAHAGGKGRPVRATEAVGRRGLGAELGAKVAGRRGLGAELGTKVAGEADFGEGERRVDRGGI